MPLFSKSRPKVFCIGRNKTGTTSLARALRELGYKVAPQKPAELLTEDWAVRSFGKLVRFCRRFDAFQDTPFSLNFTYAALDQAFPGAKFILSIRRDADEWFDSVLRFNRRMLRLDAPPTAKDLAGFDYCGDPSRKGELWRRHQLVYGVDEESAFRDRETYTRHYEFHNACVRDYFRHRPHDLLELNVSEPDAMERLCRFLNISYRGQKMPHENASA